jgi:hypothetical protein
MVKKRTRRFWIVVVLIGALLVALLPALIAFRYTAASQRMEFVKEPWRGWSFAIAALAVPPNAKLKTSGQALRRAVAIYRGSVVDPREIQLLFVPSHTPYRFTHSLGSRTVTSTVVPTYRFIWQVEGRVDTIPNSGNVIVGLLDYNSGALLYDARKDLPAKLDTPTPGDVTPSPSPSAP